MNTHRVEKVEAEIARVQERIAAWKAAEAGKKWDFCTNPRETGALRRASLDLTRALADMRKPEVYE